MNDFILATSSTCDLDRSWLEEHHIPFISYTYEFEGKVFEDDCTEFSRRVFYGKMKEGKLPSTSQVSVFRYMEFFKLLLREGKPVLYLEMDRAISGSFNNAVLAAIEIREDDSDAILWVVNTGCITMGMALLIKEAYKLKESGASFEEVRDFAREYGKKTAHRFLVDDLQWLRRGGRLSNASAFIGTLLSIKPVIYLPEDGSLVAYTKLRGKLKAMSQLISDSQKDIGEGEGKKIIVGFSDNKEEGEKWKERVKEAFPKASSVELMELGPVIGCHVGPGFLSIVYFAEERRP